MARLSANISDRTAASLKTLASTHDTSVTEQIRRAVRLLEWLDGLDPRDRVQVVHRDGKVTRVKVL